MKIGQKVWAKIDGKIEECTVEKIGNEDLLLNTGLRTVSKKFWEIKKIKDKNEEKN